MKLMDGLYGYPWTDMSANNANSYIIRTDVTVLVDPGHLQLMKHLLQSIRMDGIHEESVQGLIGTHAHPDHIEGFQAFSSRPVWIALGLKEAEFLKAAGPAMYRMMGVAAPDFRIDIFLKEGELKLGGEPFEVLEVPGHSPGSICLYWPANKALISGDVVFEMGIGRADLPGGDPKALLKGIDRLSKLDVEILLPGHGNPIVGKDRIKRNFELIKETYRSYE